MNKKEVQEEIIRILRDWAENDPVDRRKVSEALYYYGRLSLAEKGLFEQNKFTIKDFEVDPTKYIVKYREDLSMGAIMDH